ncbi:hypothetical protein [Roseomonas rosulenta]|uniref:hypothetical protein n=1 Tax=Roseomonas rosulenta TaxID=2748667 RepID=UPI0018DF79EC|nr:hypothetical protein [Roseomonas rosulenta]
MVLRTLAFILFGAAFCIGFFMGWGYPLGQMLYGVNASALASRQVGLERLVGPAMWNAAFVPLLALPAWGLPAFIGMVLMIIAAMRPGRG